jgi:hypothetical protein
MDRSRADEVLREWASVARSARRPFSAPKPQVTRTALPAGLLAGATLVVVIAFVVGFGSRANHPAAGSSSPGASASVAATASASPSASASASETASAPSASPSATINPFARRAASAVASVPNCDITDLSSYPIVPVISGGDMFIECSLPDSGRQIVARVNLTTNNVIKTYATDMGNGVERGFAVAGGAVWIQINNGSACSSTCTGFFHVFRIDLASGKATRDLVDRTFVGLEHGYVVVADLSGHFFELDPVTGDSKGQISSTVAALASADVACGSTWGIDSITSSASTTVTRMDPATGNVLARYTEPGKIGRIQQVGSECWAVAWTGFASDDTSYHFVRITPSGIDFRSPIVPTGTRTEIFDGTFWIMTDGTADTNPATNSNSLTTIQRIDPATWQPTGPVWTYTGAAPAFAAGGSLWAAQAGEPSPALDRLDVPMGAIGS